MRNYVKNQDFSVHAIAGTYVVIFGMNARQVATRGLLGFGIERTNNKTNKKSWLYGLKTFQAVEPNPIKGKLYSTSKHPIQSFLWGDYTAEPNCSYKYRIVPFFGQPTQLDEHPGSDLTIEIHTEKEDDGMHGIYFNRGVSGSQAYTREFGLKHPDDVPNREAYKWLSRGLEEALLEFINKAKDQEYGLRASVYEFNYLPVLQAFRDAAANGAKVEIIYHARKPDFGRLSQEAITESHLNQIHSVRLIPRQKDPSYISHNKFIILLEENPPDTPIGVWTGSTNLTRSGIFGQSNVGHIIWDKGVAKKYDDYWNELSADPKSSPLKGRTEILSPVPAGPPDHNSITPIFSPRSTFQALDWYADRMNNAQSTICLTLAFNLDRRFQNVLQQDKDYIRYILFDKYDDKIELIKDTDTITAVGDKADKKLDRWLEEVPRLSKSVLYIHTKYLLIDPLSQDPLIITGSANFSENSTKRNDENMVVIRGNMRVADIYLGEFARLFNHHYARYLARRGNNGGTAAGKYLIPSDLWCKSYYEISKSKCKERLLFCGIPLEN